MKLSKKNVQEIEMNSKNQSTMVYEQEQDIQIKSRKKKTRKKT